MMTIGTVPGRFTEHKGRAAPLIPQKSGVDDVSTHLLYL